MSAYPLGTVAWADIESVGSYMVMHIGTPYGTAWAHTNGETDEVLTSQDRLSNIRPLVVLDLDDGDARMLPRLLRRLADREQTESDKPGRLLVTTDALRKVADQIEAQTKPRRIAEPTGLGAVVRAVCECQPEPRIFLLETVTRDFPNDPWKAYCGHHTWNDLIDPTLVRPGIEDES